MYNQAQTRTHVRSNPNSPEMRYAEALLENPDSVLDGACYKEAGDCKNQSVTKTCEESVQYGEAACKETLDVHIKSLTQSFSRVVTPPRSKSEVSFDLQTCPPRDWRCTVANTALLAPSCEKVVVSVTRNSQPVSVTKQPDCSDSKVNVQLPRRGINSATLHITVTEYVSEDQWKTGDCERIKTEHPNSPCFLESSQSCLEPNQVKGSWWGCNSASLLGQGVELSVCQCSIQFVYFFNQPGLFANSVPLYSNACESLWALFTNLSVPGAILYA